MALNMVYTPGQTPLDTDEAAQLIPKHITTQGDLNEWEQANILRALPWTRSPKSPPVLTEEFARELHRRMFDKTWRWAGKFRQSDKNIGCDWRQVPMRVNQLLGNMQYWLDENVYPVDEAAVRFHHAFVLIHAFPNGNGRHARLMTDCLLKRSGAEPFTWGHANLLAGGEARNRYLGGLRAADAGDFAGLMQFVRS
jgi:Fic-DOC domain mobile mystery protein B